MKWKAAALVSALLCAAPPALAQQSIEHGSVSGRVTDPSALVVPGAMVSMRQLQTNVTATVITDRQGRFRFPYLRIGSYELVVHLEGFEDTRRTVTLTAGSAFDLPLTLNLAGVDANITVTGQASALEGARSQIAATVEELEVRALPMSGRQFLELALVAPGVSPTNIPSTQLFAETSAVPGVSLSVGSQRNLSNNFTIDGLSGNDDAAGLSGSTFGVDAVEQFQVVTSGAQAELGRALGGYVNVVTKSGSNTVEGTLYTYFRDDRFNARNMLSGTKLPMHQSQYGASLGGPLVPNRTFYFANVEQRRLDQSGLVTIPGTTVGAVNQRLAEIAYRGPVVTSGQYPAPVDTTNALSKVDHQVSGRDQATVRYSLYKASAANSRGAGGLNAPSAASALDNTDHVFAIGNTYTVSSHTVIESRAQVAYGDLKAPPTDPIGPAVTIAGVAAFGTSSGSPTRRINRLYQVVNNVSHHAGAHAFRVGADFLYNDTHITYPRAIRGSYAFASLASFNAGVYNNAGFTQTFGISDVAVTNPNVAAYVQDEWNVAPGLTVNLGVRYDLQLLYTITTDDNNVSPRMGAAWAPFHSRRTIVRGSAGLFFDRVPLRALANAMLSAGNTTDLANLRQITVSLSPGQAGAPDFPNTLAAVVPGETLVNLTTMDRHLQNAYSRQVSVEIEQQLGGSTSFNVGYQYLRGLNLLMSINQNVPGCIASGTNNGCRPNPTYANNNQYSSVGDSNYHGLHVSLLQRTAGRGYYRLSYTLSKSMNNVGEFFFSSPIDPFDLSKDWGRSDDDQRHRLVVTGAANLRHGFQLSGMVHAYSAPPFNITSGLTTVQGTAGRPIVDGSFIGRNTGAGSAFVNVNARLARVFRLGGAAELEAMIEGFNLTNHRNVVARNANFGAGAYPLSPATNFGQITAVGEPRALQLGARVRF